MSYRDGSTYIQAPPTFFPKCFQAYLASSPPPPPKKKIFFFWSFLGPKKDLNPLPFLYFYCLSLFVSIFFYAILINIVDSQEKRGLHLLPLAKTSLWKDEEWGFAKSLGESGKEVFFLIKNFLFFMPSQPLDQGIIIFNFFSPSYIILL